MEDGAGEEDADVQNGVKAGGGGQGRHQACHRFVFETQLEHVVKLNSSPLVQKCAARCHEDDRQAEEGWDVGGRAKGA